MANQDLKQRLAAKAARGEMIVTFGAGIGLTARIADRAGVDILSLYSTASVRMAGLPSHFAFLPYGNCNEHTWELGREALPLIKDTPCLAGLGAHDPRLDSSDLVARAANMGFSGVCNEPFVGIYGPGFGAELEAAGVGFSQEVALISAASKAGLYTFGWAFSAGEATRMTDAGADIVGAMVGVTGESGAGVLARATQAVDEMSEAAKRANPDVLVIAHGGPFKDVESVTHVFNNTGCDGYAAGSSGERIPTELSVREVVKDFRALRKKTSA